MAAPSLRQLSEGDLSRWFAPALLNAAEDYLVAERLRRPVAAGGRLAARIEGFRGDYDVSAALPGGGAGAATAAALAAADRGDCEEAVFDCSCGQRQPCRHSAALVLAWLRRRAWFTDLDVLLQPLAAAPPEAVLALLGRVAVEAEDRLTPLLEAVQELGADAWAEPGRWLEPAEAAAAVVALAGRWDEASSRLKDSRDDIGDAWQELLSIAEQGVGLLGRTRDEEGLLTRFVAACLAQFAPLADATARPLAARRAAVRVLAQVIGGGVAELARPAAAALAALAGPDRLLTDLAVAMLLGQAWLQDAEWRAGATAAPAGVLVREGLLLEAAADLLTSAGREGEAAARIEPFPHVWQAVLRRVAILRRLNQAEAALQAARAGLEHSQGQASLDLHGAAGELLVALGRPADAVPHLLACCLGRPSAANLQPLREAATASGCWPEAERQLRAAGLL